VRFDIVRLNDVRAERKRGGGLSHEFLRVPALSLTVYELPAGADDPQLPHAEDEVYYLVSGRAEFEVGGERRPVAAGDVVFVAAEVPHRFVEIEDDLTLLVVFAPAKSR
jgi:mannose-6-phosphate isomerase-like protein (cupin superfamily)